MEGVVIKKRYYCDPSEGVLPEKFEKIPASKIEDVKKYIKEILEKTAEGKGILELDKSSPLEDRLRRRVANLIISDEVNKASVARISLVKLQFLSLGIRATSPIPSNTVDVKRVYPKGYVCEVLRTKTRHISGVSRKPEKLLREPQISALF